jgi:hypothetical protein
MIVLMKSILLRLAHILTSLKHLIKTLLYIDINCGMMLNIVISPREASLIMMHIVVI